MRFFVVSLCLWGGLAVAAPLPPDARLDGERAALQALVDAAEHDGLPLELLTAKIREGLAKGVPAARITGAVRLLAAGLRDARNEALSAIPKPPAALLKAIVDAHALGVDRPSLALVLKAAAASGASSATRAVEVLGDLVQHAFPQAAAARTVAAVTTSRISRVAGSLVDVPARAEALSQLKGVSRTEALDAIVRSTAHGLALDEASKLLRGHELSDDDDGRGPPRDTTGNRGPHGSDGKGKDH
jgi:hypothetical protein